MSSPSVTIDDLLWLVGPDDRYLLFLRVPEPKQVKNRMHLCLRPTERSRDANGHVQRREGAHDQEQPAPLRMDRALWRRVALRPLIGHRAARGARPHMLEQLPAPVEQ